MNNQIYNPYSHFTQEQFQKKMQELKDQQRIAFQRGDSDGINRIGYAIQDLTSWMNKMYPPTPVPAMVEENKQLQPNLPPAWS